MSRLGVVMRRALVAAVLACVASSGTEERQVLYERRHTPNSWNLKARAAKHQRMHLLVAVKQQNLAILEDRFWAVSDPKSRQWQKFMTKDEIGELVRSKSEDMEAVMTWLQAGLSTDSNVVQSDDAVELFVSVGEVEELFETEIYSFTHDSGHTILRAMGSHSVPSSIAKVIDFVEGIADFPMHRSSGHKQPTGPETFGRKPLVSPQTIQQMYSVPTVPKMANASQGPAEFQSDLSFNKEDLQMFFQKMDLPEQNVSHIVGPYTGQIPDTEATLDVQYIMGVGQKHDDWYWTSEGWMYMWSHTFFNHDEVPDVMSISWGWAEDQQCSDGIAGHECKTIGVDSPLYVKRVNAEFQKIGLRGVSLLVASGDSGANGRSDSRCTDDKLHASFPGSSPYVTAVGATMLEKPEFKLKDAPPACHALGFRSACASGGLEVAVNLAQAGFTSGGGFSTYSDMPAYQRSFVTRYFDSMEEELPPASYFNRSHRGYPDVSALGSNFLVLMEKSWTPVGGTSAAAPTVAGIASFLNDLSYSKKGKPLGFLNPLLYQMAAEAPEAFTDVTIGDNKCTEGGCSEKCKGYQATKGWDPVTGLGTPVASKMLAYLGKELERASQESSIVV